MKRKKIVQIASIAVLAAALLAGTAGCGSKSSSDATQAEETSSDTSIEDSGESGTAFAESAEDSTELTTIRAAVTSNAADHIIDLIGEETGIFAEYGIELEITEFAAGINTVDAITTDQADIGAIADFALVNRIGNTLEDTDLRILGRMSSMGEGYHLYSDGDSVSDLSDLAGQTILTMTGTVTEYWNAKLLEQAGLTEDDVDLVGVDSQSVALTLLTSGDASVMWASGMTILRLEEAGMTDLGNLTDYGMSNHFLYVAGEGYIEDHKDTLVTFFRAAEEVAEWISDNSDEAAEILADIQELEVDEETAVLDSIVYTMDYSDEITGQIEEIQEWAYENGLYDTSFAVGEFVDTGALKEALPDHVN